MRRSSHCEACCRQSAELPSRLQSPYWGGVSIGHDWPPLPAVPSSSTAASRADALPARRRSRSIPAPFFFLRPRGSVLTSGRSSDFGCGGLGGNRLDPLKDSGSPRTLCAWRSWLTRSAARWTTGSTATARKRFASNRRASSNVSSRSPRGSGNDWDRGDLGHEFRQPATRRSDLAPRRPCPRLRAAVAPAEQPRTCPGMNWIEPAERVGDGQRAPRQRGNRSKRSANL